MFTSSFQINSQNLKLEDDTLDMQLVPSEKNRPAGKRQGHVDYQ